MMNNNNNNLPFLPADITINILSRLPVESVLRCKHVCKTWQTLINDPVFVRTHAGRLLLHDNISFGFLLCTYRKGIIEYRFGEYSMSSGFRLKIPINHEPFPLDDDPNYKQKCLNLVDSCNGLICLVSTSRDDYNVCVYNPLTREYVNLLPRFNIPPINNGRGTYKMLGHLATGFGYHPGTKEYKIVRIYYANKLSPGQVSVYTLGSGGGWRSKGETSHLLYSGHSGVFANGALHWLSNRLLFGINKYIVAFDLVDEELRIIPSPPPIVHDIELGVLEGCLSATGTNSDSPQSSSDVWVMSTKHDHDQEYTWSKKYNIPWNEPQCRYNPSLAPLLKEDDKILLHYGYMKIVFYDTKRACLDDNVHTMKLVHAYRLIPYMKSITSLKALGEDGARIGRTAAAAAANSTTTTTQQQLITSRKRKRT